LSRWTVVSSPAVPAAASGAAPSCTAIGWPLSMVVRGRPLVFTLVFGRPECCTENESCRRSGR
jgi:hypothetical protein